MVGSITDRPFRGDRVPSNPPVRPPAVPRTNYTVTAERRLPIKTDGEGQGAKRPSRRGLDSLPTADCRGTAGLLRTLCGEPSEQIYNVSPTWDAADEVEPGWEDCWTPISVVGVVKK